ncbi:MAG: M1 family aminopeptidase [Chitinophagales bacterium]
MNTIKLIQTNRQKLFFLMKLSQYFSLFIIICICSLTMKSTAQDTSWMSQKRSLFSYLEKNALPDDGGIRAENSRSDSIDILDYHISLSITDFTNKMIGGNCAISLRSKIEDCSFIDLDLLGLTVDSVIQNNEALTFTYSNDVLLRANFVQPLNSGDSSSITVYYHGVPQVDVTGWGGFYFSGDYAYNLGVGFGADPHPFGRAWFPCFDNFIERSTFHFSITTVNTKMALCNGELTSSLENSDGTKTWNWEMLQTIPSYLACVAVGNYSPAHLEYTGINGTIPVQLGAIAADTTKMKNSFAHLLDALSVFETSFGAYQWNKVGYSLVPFSSGAMEHATNIAYPVFMANGTLDWEDFYVHELSHHWFGDLVTCRTQEDMWLNEGWAAYCERLFHESVYGKTDYDIAIANNHAQVVHYAHTPAGDGSYLPVSGISHDYTYGTTVYDKGADVVHTLRGYLGDSLFFHCVTNYLSEFAFRDASSEDLRDYLTACSGIDLYHFFDDWIFSPGFPQFSIDSMEVSPDGSAYAVTVYIRQKLDHAPHFYQQVPLEITFKDQFWNTLTESTILNGPCGIYSTILPFNPVYAGLDLLEKISDAITSGTNTVKTTGLQTFANGGITLNVSTLPDSAFIRVEHNYAPPDPFKFPVPGLHISDYHYWKMDGLFPAGFDASAIIHYDGSTFTSGGYLDNNLITNVEDSIVMLYRSSCKNDWEILSDVIQNFTGSHTDKRGYFTVNHAAKGEYAFGIFDYDKVDSAINFPYDPCQLLSEPVIAASSNADQLLVFPNPANETLTISIKPPDSNALIEIYNLYGRLVFHENAVNGRAALIIDVHEWPVGPYMVCKTDTKNHKLTTSIIIIN